MNLKNIAYVSFLVIALASCNGKKESKEALVEEERIAFEKTADSLEAVSAKIDSLNMGIQETSNEIDELLNEFNEQ